MKKFAFPIFLLLFLCLYVHADQIEMVNGDRLTGKIIRKDGDFVVISTDATGEVRVKWSMVARVEMENEMNVTLADGNVEKGKLLTDADGKIKLKIDAEKELAIEKKQIKSVRNEKEQTKFEADQQRILASRFVDFWGGTIDLGFSMTEGNAKTRTFNFGARGAREVQGTKLSVYANALQVKNSTNGVRRTTAQSVWSGARYDIDINKKWFGFGSGDFEYNKPQKLDLRAVLGGGVGYHVKKSERLNFDVTTGATNNYEKFSTGLKRNSAELLGGNELRLKINNRVRLIERGVVYPNLSNPGQFRMLFDGSLQTDLSEWLAWHVTIGNRYNSRPVAATQKNDFLMSTGLRFSLGKNRKR